MKKIITIVVLIWGFQGVRAEIRDGEGLTPLHRAAGNGDLAEVKKLVESGADIYAVDSRMGYSVLHKAVYSGNPAVVQFLIEKGSLVNLQNPGNGDTPLLDALFFKKNAHGKEIIDLLLKAGSSLAVKTRAGFTPLEAAKALKDQEAVQQIQDELARRYTPKGKALMNAVRERDLKVVQKCLADSKTPIDEADIDGFTPLLWAAREGMTQIASLLLSRGASPNHLDIWMGANAGHKAGYWGRTEVMKVLVKTNMDINARGLSNGYTPLHDAVSGNHFETAKVLVDAGAKLGIKGHDGLTPLDIAKANGNEKLVRLLDSKVKTP
jgi:ankyrin repeat protein